MNSSQKRAILCPGCRKLVSADEPLCPYCGMKRPGSLISNNPVSRGFSDPAHLMRTILYANIGMFIVSLLFNPTGIGMSVNPLTALSPDFKSLLLLGSTGTVPIGQLHRWWSLVSANYLHGSLLHIAFNMIAFYQLAPLVIREYGTHRMLTIYTVGGTLGFAISYLAGVKFTIGASAAVCSLMGSVLYYGKSRGGLYGQLVYKQVGVWAISLFVFGLIVPGINNWGHGGGLVGGALLGLLLGYKDRIKETALHRWLGWICATGTVLILLWAIVIGCYYRFG